MILLLGGAALMLVRGRASLDLLPLNCAVLRDDEVCEFDQPELRLYIGAPPPSRVWIFGGKRAVDAHFLSAPRPVKITTTPVGPRRIVVLALAACASQGTTTASDSPRKMEEKEYRTGSRIPVREGVSSSPMSENASPQAAPETAVSTTMPLPSVEMRRAMGPKS